MADFDRTTIVVGAGASVDFGFPTGDGLIGTISKLADIIVQDKMTQEYDHRTFGAYLRQVREQAYAGVSDLQGVRKSAARLRDGLWLSASIDNFLYEQEDQTISQLGKYLIVASILLHEKFSIAASGSTGLFSDHNKLWSCLEAPERRQGFSPLRDTWLVPFFRSLRGQCNAAEFSARLENLTLIIFNYDRSVELFLHRAMKVYGELNDEQATELLSKIQIIHPYGSIGELPFQSIDGVAYGESDGTKFGAHLQKEPSIRTFGEHRAGENQADAQAAIKNSKNLVFIGFGFLKANMNYLGASTDLTAGYNKRRMVFATTYGLSEYRQNSVRNVLKQFAKSDPRFSPRDDQIVVVDGTGKDIIDEYGSEWFS